MRAAVIQLNSQDDVRANLDRMIALVTEATKAGATLIALPENFAFMGEETQKREVAESTEDGAAGVIMSTLRELALSTGAWLVAGGMPEKSDDQARPFNTSLLVAPDGNVVLRYRKIHLFDVDLPDGTKLLESGGTAAGKKTTPPDATPRLTARD